MRPLIKRKLFAGLVSAAGAAVLAMGSLTAGAFAAPNPGPPASENPNLGFANNPDGPQTANVPYVAWVGEHVRLVVCDPSINPDGFEKVQFANFAVEDWSGYKFQVPTPDGEAGNSLGQIFDPGPAAFFTSQEPAHERDGCVATDYKSLNPGLSRIRAVIRNEETGKIVFSHQFLVIWLTVNKPILSEAGTASSGTETFQSQLNGTGHGNLASFLGDPAGDGKFIPSPFSEPATGADKGLVQIKITGSFPVVTESPLSNILTNPSYTLPNDWATLAGKLSSSSEETEEPGTNTGLWDIHGTPTSEGNTSNTSSTSALFDTFSRTFGDTTSGKTATVGPFDPQAANETLLSDGLLNEYDAPMPAMRIDVAIAANKAGGLGGVGQLGEGTKANEANKARIYSRDFTGNPEAGNLYNPYYGAYIPATDRPGLNEVSGVTGSSPGGDFPGFLNKHSEPYTFWTSVKPGKAGSSHSTECLRRTNPQEGPTEYQTPSGPLTQTFYTDEHGEAYVNYTPGNQFFLENLPLLQEGEPEAPGKIIKNNDGGCDLKLLKGTVIGESSISAKALYPYEPVDYSAQTSEGPLTKTVMSEWEKEWFQFSKGPGANENTVKIIVAKAQDIDGHPFVGEAVCFVTPNGGTVSHFPGNTVNDAGNVLGFGAGNIVVGPSAIVFPAGKEGKLCETTNSNGLAAIEVTNSTLKHVDLNVEYVEENILRDHEVNFVTPAEEKAEKAAAEKAAKEAAEKTATEQAAAEKAANEAAEKTANEQRAKEVAEKKITETEATEKAATEKAANEAKVKAAEEQRAKEVEEAAKAAAKKASVTPAAVTTTTTTTSSTTSGATSLLTPAPALSLGTVSGSGTKSLTGAQKLAKALKACKKLPKSKRAACEAKAEKAYSAKNKKHKK
jgi:hypothetical protein